ncbi:hypothetical protein CFI00_08815 [Nocardioides sp. S5]|jgi:hypothetical protein|uniref:hypothetical protein n=1 Tax=Nocardioides sp. S5 TaxID=2017486 RepID=UPI001A8D46E9|nr:hypothetical protein [Nocardioides sp. S5]QSR30598.1 hypothetical protein CFI00_08815 [Nocardioides sp. S5]
MCTPHTNADTRTSERGETPASAHCGHCNHDDLTIEELKGRRAQLDRDIAARELGTADSPGARHNA